MAQICYLVFPFQNETSVHRLIDVKVFNIENMEMTQRCSLPTNYEMDEGKLTKKSHMPLTFAYEQISAKYL